MYIYIPIASSILISWIYLAWTQRNNPRAKKVDREWQVMCLSASFFGAAGLMVWQIIFVERIASVTGVIAITCAVSGSMLRVLGIRVLGQNFSWGSAPPKEIVHRGIYRRMRHPLIIGYVLQTMGMSLAGNDHVVLRALPIIGVIIAAWMQIRREEREIRRCFENY